MTKEEIDKKKAELEEKLETAQKIYKRVKEMGRNERLVQSAKNRCENIKKMLKQLEEKDS